MDLELLRSAGTMKSFDENETVFLENEAGSSMYIPVQGTFGVYINSFVDFPIRIAEIPQGSFFGEMSVIDGSNRSATIISETKGMALVVESDKFGLLVEKSHEFTQKLLMALQKRLETTAEKIKETGITAPDIVGLDERFAKSGSNMQVMLEMATEIRKMNEILIPKVEEEADINDGIDLNAKGDGTNLKLLPVGYEPFDKIDENINDFMLEEKNMVCPYCNARITGNIPIPSALKEEANDLDGRIIYKDFNILLYTNIVCSECYFTDTYQEFSKGRLNREARQMEVIKFETAERFTGYANPLQHTYDEAVLSYYLQHECLRKTTRDSIRYAKSWIRLYWLYKDKGDKENMEVCAEKAEYYYSQFLDGKGGDLNTYDIMRLHAIIAELVLVFNNYTVARDHFKQIQRLSNDTQNAVALKFADAISKKFEEIRKL
jgi:CRP-like cAMP-binding protein